MRQISPERAAVNRALNKLAEWYRPHEGRNSVDEFLEAVADWIIAGQPEDVDSFLRSVEYSPTCPTWEKGAALFSEMDRLRAESERLLERRDEEAG
jgi:hypothetical protein